MRALWIVLAIAGCGSKHGAADAPTGSDDDAASTDAATTDAIPACPAGQWCIETAPITGAPLLHAIWAVDANDVFAVGDAGTIIHRHANQWTQMTSGTQSDLRGVWAASATDAWAVGNAGTVLHYNGAAWQPITGVTGDVEAVWGSSANDIWIAGPSTVWHSTGGAFAATGIAGSLFAISGTGPNDVWVTGENTNLHHYTGTWTTVNPNTGSTTFYTVLALSTSDVWATTFFPGYETIQSNGATWNHYATTSSVFQSLHARAANDLWGVGSTRVGHWTGSAWTIDMAPFGTSTSLWSITGAGPQLWLVGDAGLIAHRID